eukprot:scaffold2182_cov198-Amphora_coffeaeformis.AAC.18
MYKYIAWNLMMTMLRVRGPRSRAKKMASAFVPTDIGLLDLLVTDPIATKAFATLRCTQATCNGMVIEIGRSQTLYPKNSLHWHAREIECQSDAKDRVGK